MVDEMGNIGIDAILLNLIKEEEEFLKQIKFCMNCGLPTPLDKNQLITNGWTAIYCKPELKAIDTEAFIKDTYNYLKTSLPLLIGLKCKVCSEQIDG